MPPTASRDMRLFLGTIAILGGALFTLFSIDLIHGVAASPYVIPLLGGPIVGMAAVVLGARTIWLACWPPARNARPRSGLPLAYGVAGSLLGLAVAAAFNDVVWGLLLCPLLVLPLGICGLITGAWLQSFQPAQAPPQRPLIPPEVEAALREHFHPPAEQDGIQEAPGLQVMRDNRPGPI